MTDTPPPGAADAAHLHGDASALAKLDIRELDTPRPLSPAEAQAAFAVDAPARSPAKPAVQSSTIMAAITAAAPAVVLLADDIGRVVHGPALNMNEQLLAAGAIVTVAGAATAIWGRWRASAPIAGWLKVRS